ncbi:HIT family protein [Actinomycetaceae bacterium MB13-C1-2]|nr:HIT family protein [Actinomycetaceae bacterium MB13-C1-2]
MSTIFEKILGGQIPGKFVWKDEKCFAILDINPVAPGHTLVIPREPIDKWTDLPDELRSHLFDVAAKIGRAQELAFDVPRSVVIIAGFEVPHAHVHVIPATSEGSANLGNGAPVDSETFEDAYRRLTAVLADQGFEEMVLRADTKPEDANEPLDI